MKVIGNFGEWLSGLTMARQSGSTMLVYGILMSMPFEMNWEFVAAHCRRCPGRRRWIGISLHNSSGSIYVLGQMLQPSKMDQELVCAWAPHCK